MKIKYANKIYEVVDTVEFDGRIYYTVEDEPGHYDTFTNISDEDIVDPSPINRRAKHKYKTRKLEEEIDEDDTEMYEAVSELPDKLRAAIHLHYYEGYSLKEIADILDIAPSAVSMRLTRAKEILKKRFTGGSRYAG